MAKFNRLIFLLFFFLTVPGIVMSIFLYGQFSNRYQAQYVSFNNDRGDSVQGILYVPEAGKKLPALVSIHAGAQNREALQPAARVLAENGIVVLDLILHHKKRTGGKRTTFEDYLADARGSVRYLLSRDFVDPERVFLSGHSIGANVSSMVTGTADNVAGEIAVGYPVEFSPRCKAHLLMTAGVFDELHPVSKLLATFEGAQGRDTANALLYRPAAIGTQVQKERTSRIYYISPLSDHYIEPLDPDIVAATTCFIKTLGGEQMGKYEPWRGIRAQLFTRIALFFSLFLFFFMALNELYVGRVLELPEKSGPKLFLERLGIVIFVFFFVAVGFVHHPAEHNIHIYILSSMFVALLAANLFMRKCMEPGRIGAAPKAGTGSRVASEQVARFFLSGLAKVFFYGAAFYAGYILGLFVHAGIYPYLKPDLLMHMLGGPFFLVPAQIFVFCTRVNGLFLTGDFAFNFFSPVVWIIIALELGYPGAAGKILDEFFTRVIQSIERLDLRIKFKFNPAEIILFIVVLTIGVLLWRQILSEGYAFGFSELLGMGYLFLSFIVLPLVTFTIIVRSKRVKDLFTRR